MTDTVTELGSCPRKASLGLVFLIVFIDLLGFAIVLPLLPRYAERFNASDATIGMLFASFSAMQFLFAPVWGRISDHVGRRPVLLAGLLGSVVFYALFGMAAMQESLALLFAARIGAGICGATISTAQACIADVTTSAERGRGMALIGAAFGAGFTFGPILGSIGLPHAAVGSGEPPPLNALPGFIAAGLSFVALMLAWVKLPESLRGDSAPALGEWFSIGAIRQAVRIPSIGWLLMAFFITTLAFAMYESTLSRLTAGAFALDDRFNFYLFSYIGLVLSVVQGGLVRALIPRVGEARLLVAGTLLMAVGLGLVSFSVSQNSLVMLMVVMPVLICGFAFVTPCAHALISRRADPRTQGEILGINQSASAIARIIGPWWGNVLFGRGMVLPYHVSVLLLVPAVILAVLCAAGGRDWTPANDGLEVETANESV